MNHPAPWEVRMSKIGFYNPESRPEIYDADGRIVVALDDEITARRIVAAVNAHEAVTQ